MKYKIVQLLQPLVPVVVWGLILLKPEYSIGAVISKVYQLSPTDLRAIDILAFSTLSTYTLFFLSFLFELFDKRCAISVGLLCQDTLTENDRYIMLEPPDGNIKRVKVSIKVECKFTATQESLISRFYSKLELRLFWPCQWVTCELDDIEPTKYKIEDGFLSMPLVELVGTNGGLGKATLAMVTQHINTESGFLLGQVKLKESKWNLMLKPIKWLFLKDEHFKYELRLLK